MSKVIFFNIPAHGHTNPTLPLVTEMINRGEDVLYYSVEMLKEKIQASGAKFRGYEPAMEFDDSKKIGENLLEQAYMLLKGGEDILSYHLDKIKEEKPDYIIHDSLCAWGKLFKEILKIPAITTVSTFAFNLDKLFPQFHFMMGMIKMTLEAFPQVIEYHKTADRLKAKYNIPVPHIKYGLYHEEDLNLVFTSRLFQPNDEAFGDNYRFIGPSMGVRPGDSDFPYDKLKDKPVVYISLGTINNENLEFFDNCIEAFRDEDMILVLSIGKKLDISRFKDAPDNFIIKPRVPQVELLKHCDVFITHGGMNSVSESFYMGVPMVAVPQTMEQVMVAEQVANLGGGILMKNKEPKPGVLKEAVKKILSNESFKKNAVKIGDSFREAGGPKRGVDEIFSFKERMGVK